MEQSSNDNINVILLLTEIPLFFFKKFETPEKPGTFGINALVFFHNEDFKGFYRFFRPDKLQFLPICLWQEHQPRFGSTVW